MFTDHGWRWPPIEPGSTGAYCRADFQVRRDRADPAVGAGRRLPSRAVVPERVRPVVEETAELTARFVAAGKRIYIVGGTVRDAVVGPPGGGEPFGRDADIDLTTDALPDEIESLVEGWAEAVWLQGKRFGTIGCRHAGRRFEITTHRAEAYLPESRKPDVQFGDDIGADLSRRDFTVNAMALALPAVELIDPYDGLGDLAARKTAHAPRPDGVVLGRPAAHAARRPFPRRVLARADRGAGGGGGRAA